MAKLHLIFPSTALQTSFGVIPAISGVSTALRDFAAPARKSRSHGPYALAFVGKVLSKCSEALASPHAAFAIRCASAVLCSQIPAYLRNTQQWYNQQRVLWTSITVSRLVFTRKHLHRLITLS